MGVGNYKQTLYLHAEMEEKNFYEKVSKGLEEVS